VVRFRHLLPFAASVIANVEIIRTTSNYMFLVEFLNLTFNLPPFLTLPSPPLQHLAWGFDLHIVELGG
jgi:hypothetical protein